jgi:acyl-coenzyme A synthetase/AMP-(fatty) acid ligase
MLASKTASLWQALDAGRGFSEGVVFSEQTGLAWKDLLSGSCFGGEANAFRGRSVLLATTDQLLAVSALIELDGIARRIVLYPPDLLLEHLSFVAEAAGADVLVSDRDLGILEGSGVQDYIRCDGRIIPGKPGRDEQEQQTEWVLLTSGTTGRPKLVVHTLASLMGAIQADRPISTNVVWSTFYDIRRYGGLQILLRAALGGTSMVLSSARESTADFLARAGAHAVTHISGTPSHWRRALMSPAAHLIAPQYVRLSGEIADQAILNQLRSFFPQASISHAFASTEAGVAFDVKDGLTGLPSSIIRLTGSVEMKVENGSLRIRSERTASRYLNEDVSPLRDAEGFVDTGDVLELRGDRYYFIGRRDGVINVGGLKVHPEEVEDVINRHPQVRMSLVRTRKNPLTGALVVADVVLKTPCQNDSNDDRALQQDILLFCREALPSHKVPAVINFVGTLAVAETGKLIRRYA